MAETLLTVEHLIKKYGDQVILDDVSLDVKKGEVIVVVGPSGCGKMSAVPKPDDTADALAMAITFCHTNGNQLNRFTRRVAGPI